MTVASSPRILVIRRRYLGDIVLLRPFLRNLRLHWPAAKITLLVEERFSGILSLIEEVDEVLCQTRHRVRSFLTLWRGLRRGRFTHVLDLDCNDRSALFTSITGAPMRSRLGVHNRHTWIYTHPIRVDRSRYLNCHISETYLSLLSSLGIPIISHEFALVPKPEDLNYARSLLKDQASINGRTLAVHPGSRSTFRLWPAERFAKIIDRAHDECGVKVILIGGPSEGPLLEEIQKHAVRKHALISSPLSLPQLAALMKLCTVLLCHDSGPMHLSAAVGTPVVALFGSQSKTLWHPLGEGHVVLQAAQPCLQCVSPTNCVPENSYENYCVRRITIEDVFDALRGFFSATDTTSEKHVLEH